MIKQKTNKILQPREKLQLQGAQSLRDVELIAILLSSGGGKNTVAQLAKKVLSLLDRSSELIDIKQLIAINGIGLAKACIILAALEFSRRRYKPIPRRIRNPEDIFHCVAHLADRQENFIILTLNGANELLNTRIITKGTLNQTLIHPREIFADAIADRAAAVVMAHNHPSGDLQPSAEDLKATEIVVRAGLIIGIELYDHIIFNHSDYFSLQQHGYL